jgi:hypothetical protein
MRRPHRLDSGLAVACLFATLAGAFPLLAQTVISVDEDPLEELEKPSATWTLPGEMIGDLARRAEEYEQAALSLECRETMHRVKYPRPGRTAERIVGEATYLLELEGHSLVPARLRDRSLRRVSKITAPSAFAWTQLFALHNQPYMAYRDVGEVPYAFGMAREIQFRGALPYTDGKDIREWEGTVLVDSFSLLPLEIDARPRSFWPRLRHQYDAYNRSFKFVFFGLPIRFKKKPFGARVHVRFDMQSDGLTLPVAAHVDRVEMVLPDRVIVRRRTVVDYDTYEFSDADAPDTSMP